MKLPEPFTYFVDRSLGRNALVTRLRAAGLRVEAHDDRFAANTADAEWLGAVGQRGWVVLTKDKAIRRNALERETLLEARVACFMLGRGDLSAEQMARAFLTPFHECSGCFADSRSRWLRVSRQPATSHS